MAPLRSLVAAAVLFLSAANAHFLLNLPVSLEGANFDEDSEPNSPCGGGKPDLSSNTATDFHVGGDSIALKLAHTQANFLFRATLDSHAAGNWTQLFPIVQQSGLGDYCVPAVTAPQEWVGKKGFISVVCDAPDGLLYQCAAVNFVSGSNSKVSSTCNNGSAVSVSFNTDPKLSALLGSGSASNSSSSSSSGSSATSSSPAASSTNAAPSSMLRGSELPIGSFAVTAAMLLLGAALL